MRRKWSKARRFRPGSGEKDDPEDWGNDSSERFRQVMLPAILEQEWPQLQKLTLIGLDFRTGDIDLLEVLHIRGVQVQHQLGGVVTFNDDATPISVSPPNGSFSYFDIE